MQKIFLKGLWLLLFCIASLSSFAQDKKIIKLRQEKRVWQPANYHIIGVKDDRADTSSIGTVRAGIFSKKSTSLDLPGGAAHGLYEFLKANLAQEPHTTPIELHISQLEVAEQTGGLKAESEVRMTIVFYGGGHKIIEYKGNNTIQAGVDATRYIEQLIRKSLDNMLEQFDSWYGQNKEQVKASLSGPSIRVEVEMKDDTGDSDRIAWSGRRPLILDDFRGKPDDLSRAAAVTYSGVDVKYKTESLYNQVKVVVTIIPFFDKNRSWCRAASHNKKTLLHEQQHFDITAIKACELATTIRNYPFTVTDYMKELEQLYRQKEKEITQWQEQYDQETHHGLIQAAQDKWVSQVQDSVGKQPCYHR